MNLKDLGIKGAAAEPDTAPDSDLVVKWLARLEESRKLEKQFRREGRNVVQLFEGEKKESYQFNILYSNTETMLPALYNSTPRPIVKRRFQDEDVLGAAAGRVAERTLTYLTDDGNSTYTSFDDLMKSATLEALVPGRGVTRFKYDATMETVQNEKAAEGVESSDSEEEEEDADEGIEAPNEAVSYETVCGEEVPWDRFLHGQAKKWKDVPWVAFEHFMTREELEKNFGEIGALIPVSELAMADDESEKSYQTEDMKGVKIAPVYEIWDKDERVVLFISPSWKSAAIKQVPDPLGLTGFFPCPRPLTFITKISTLTPVALYTQYEEQAKELNRITVRINKLISALKVRGLYDSTVEGIAKVLTADDNVLVPAENVAAMMAQGNALEKAIWLMPIEKLVSVLQQLYIQREQIKTIIYEITGIADIMRGSSQASETLGAQQIKNRWGTLRLKKTQKEVMRYARDCLRIMAEIAVSKLAPETLKAMTGLPFPTGEEKAQAQQAAQQMQMQAQQAAMMAQQSGQPSAPPPAIPEQLSLALNQPSWDELLAVLRNDTQRNYRIDIETNSTVDAEATEDKKDISELLNAMSQFLNGIGPLIENGTMPFDVAQGILLAVVRRYRFGPELEDHLKKMQEPKDQAAGAESEKQKAEVAKAMEEVQKAQAELEKQKGQLQQEMAKQSAALEMEKEKAKLDIELAQKQFQHDQQLAAKEVEFAKQMALKEIDFANQQKEAISDQRIRAKEHSLSLKQAAHADQVSRTKETAKA